MQKKSKYNAKKVEFDGIVFDSVAERDFYITLLKLKRDGEVLSIVTQPKFEIIEAVGDMKAKHYIADFTVTYADGHIFVFDVKGMATTEAKLKRQLFAVKYPHLELMWICKSPAYHKNETGDEWIEYDELNRLRAKRKRERKKKNAESK
ncbi:DUF1064 domain-containing protein [Macrococcus armenti]|uniref:DUF1064 domain-containing protein n=1 Tax=Macrococcus armenti TaxID=2875764 RepID=UPI001CCC0D23|nr:DUF1064 domain-containing protein [Macrococcus armenti]UBH16387.1 DUF1064 domain-containing protein [Macrococcus armenti]UBH18743.1 DUF1064 domain-containing protein [Macrococcus armenti]UBH21015.1 DUF1064 domain-containing protein [Macrococcus armenti]